MLLSEALGAFVAQLEADGRSAHTIAQYERHVRLVIRELGDVDVESISHETLAKFLASPAARTTRLGEAKKPTSTNCLRSSIRSFFGFVHDAGYAQANAARLVRRARCGPPPPRALSDAEVARLEFVMSSARGWSCERDRVFVRLLLATGIRLGSAIALDIEDVDFERGELWLRTMKNARVDRVFLGAKIRDELRTFVGARTSGPLFRSAAGARLGRRQIQRRVVGWLRAAGINHGASVHALRHTFATALYRRTSDVLLVRAALTHRSIASTMVYARVDETRLRAAVSV